MSQSDVPNLINLSGEAQQNVVQQEHNSSSKILSPRGCDANHEEANNSGNNPFDAVLKQINLQNDPFEVVAFEAEQQKKASESHFEVSTTDLLGLDEYCSPKVEQRSKKKLKPAFEMSLKVSRSSAISSIGSISSLPSCCSPFDCNDSVFESVVSPIFPLGTSADTNTFNRAFLAEKSTLPETDSGGDSAGRSLHSISSNTSRASTSGAETISPLIDSNSKISGGRSVLNAAQCSSSIRKYLLKSTLSNSPINSPLNQRSKTSEENGNKSRATDEFSDSCDDINATKPNWVDSETEQDSDLELLKIPILEKIEMEAREQKLKDEDEAANEREAAAVEVVQPKPSSKVDLQTIRERVRLHKQEKNNSQDVDDLIDSLKQVVLDCSDDEQKLEANRLLESLSVLLSKKDVSRKNEAVESSTASLEVPPTIVRQGTFDLDKSDKSNCGGPEERAVEHPEMCETQVSAEVSSLAEQLGKILGNQNVNVVQANMGLTGGSALNPTYIVVMSNQTFTPVRQNTQILESSNNSPEPNPLPRGRSQSLSLHDKSYKKEKAAVPSSPTVFNTPTKPCSLKRRSTISFSPSIPTRQNSAPKQPSEIKLQRSAPVQRRHSFSKQPELPAQRRASFSKQPELPTQKVYSKKISNIGSDLNTKGLKLKSSDNLSRRTGPLKATIPVKKVLPMLITPSVSSPIESSTKTKLITSTPIPQLNSLKAFPVDCSTPSHRSPPSKTGAKSKFHSPFLSVTPNPKTAKSVLNRRRTLTDSKSPKRLSANTSVSRLSVGLRHSANLLDKGARVPSRNSSMIVPRNKENTCPK